MTYEESIRIELRYWKNEVLKSSSFLQSITKKYQNKLYEKYPEKVNKIITSSVKGIVKSTIFTLEYVPKDKPLKNVSLEQRDKLAKDLINKYKKLAAAEGASTGFGGIFLGLVDFPALIAIKMRFLFELAHIYGLDTKNEKERLFLLYIFQLTYSSKEKKPNLLSIIENWSNKDINIKNIDWEQFQREYRDSIDFRKMLQIIPGFGAVIGFFANSNLLDDLGKVGMNCYRIRLLEKD